MAIVAPFRGLTYNFNQKKDVSKLLAPPYDVISEEQREKYYHSDSHNVIRLILGKKKTGDTDWDNKYTRAAEYFQRWQSEEILVRADKPAMYLTSLSFNPGDGEGLRTRWGMIAVVKIEDEGSGVILPHEQTFSAHKDDRLSLMTAANAQLSQIFGLYEDPENSISNAFRAAVDFSPQISFSFEDGISHQMWAMEDHPVLFRKVAAAMKDKTIFIADGHHRYETARNFRNIMRARHGQKPSNKSYEYVMMYLSNLSDKGLTILPSHRLIKDLPDFEPDKFMERAVKWFEITRLPAPTDNPNIAERVSGLRQTLAEKGHGSTAIGFYSHMSDQIYILSLKPGARDALGQDIHPALKELDVLVLSRLLLQKVLGFNKQDMDNDELFHYQSSLEETFLQVSSKSHKMAFFLNPTKIEHVKEIANNRLVMPRKSTYFYPKILTGLVFNKIDPHENIQA
jgi:uncharacterized protein (DUF1015 family)